MKTPALLLPLLICGCTLNPIADVNDELQKNLTIPEQWMMQHAQTAETRQRAWWKNLGSAELDRLIEQGMAHNANLAAAGFTWQRARLAVDSAALEQSITANGSLSAEANRNFGQNSNSTSFGSNIGASYQLDLWRKLAAATQTAQWNAEAGAEDLLATRLSLQGEIAQAWLTLLYTDQRLAQNSAQMRYQEQTLNIVRSRRDIGTASDLDLANARQNLTNLQSTRRSIEAEREQAEVALTILLGTPPTAYRSDESLQTLTIPSIAAGIPAQLLSRRPDLRAAQYRLQAALGNIAVAERDFYPDLNLNATLSGGGSLLRQILQNPVGALTGSLNLPVFQYREKNIALKTGELQYQADLQTFRHTLHNALADVEKALSAVNESDAQEALLTKRLQDTQSVERLTQIRYEAGADSLQTLLDAQQTRRDSENALLDNRYQRLNRRIALYLALGGSDQE